MNKIEQLREIIYEHNDKERYKDLFLCKCLLILSETSQEEFKVLSDYLAGHGCGWFGYLIKEEKLIPFALVQMPLPSKKYNVDQDQVMVRCLFFKYVNYGYGFEREIRIRQTYASGDELGYKYAPSVMLYEEGSDLILDGQVWRRRYV